MNSRQLLIPTPLYYEYFIHLHLNFIVLERTHFPLSVDVEHIEDNTSLISIYSEDDEVFHQWSTLIENKLAHAHKIMQKYDTV